MNPTTLIMLTSATVCVSTEAKNIYTGHGLAMKPVIGAFGLGIFLFILAAANVSIAQKFCYLCIVAALLVNGTYFFSLMTGTKPVTPVKN